MAQQIGPYTFDQWGLVMPRSSRQLAALPGAPGVSGRIIISDARQTPPVSGPTITRLAGNAATAALYMMNYYRLKDALQPVTVIDQHGVLFPGCLILDVVCVPSLLIGGLCQIDTMWSIDVPVT